MEDKILRVIRVIINSLTFVIMLLLAYAFIYTNPVVSFLLVLASIDQFEDVYYYTTKRRLFPRWFMPFDIVFEATAVVIGFAILFFSITYLAYFQTWFFKSMLFISVVMIASAIEDMVVWGMEAGAIEGRKGLVIHHALREEEKERRFVRRRSKA